MKNKSGFFNMVSTLLVRCITTFIMFILPVRYLCLFLEVSMSILFVRSRTEEEEPNIDMVRFFKLVNNDYNQDIVDLPNYTLHVLWSEDLLNKEYEFVTGTHTIMTVMQNRELIKVNLEKVTDIILMNLPFLMKLKLGIRSEKGRCAFRESTIVMLNAKFSNQFA